MVDMAEHDGRGRPDAVTMRAFDHFEPLRRRDLVRADDGANLVIQNFRGGARQRAEACFFQLAQEGVYRHAEARSALPDLQRREGVDVDFGADLFDRPTDGQIGRSRIGRVDAALQADFHRATIPRLERPSLDFFELEVIGPPAQIFAELALGKGAELATEITDIGVVDVAGDDVAHRVAAMRGAQRVGRRAHDMKGIAAACEQRDDFIFVQRSAGDGPLQDRVDFIVDQGERQVRRTGWWLFPQSRNRCGRSPRHPKRA